MKMSIKFLYLDDEGESIIKHFILPFENPSFGVKITPQFPKPFEEQLKELLKGDYDGFIFDWRLDKTSNEENERRIFHAGSLVQELRTKAAESHQCEKPIVLWSTNERLMQSYNKDDTSHDLFDKKYVKEKIIENVEQIALELKSLVSGYKTLIQKRSKAKGKLSYLLNLEKELSVMLDVRLENIFDHEKKQIKPAHEYAQFILRDLIETPGPLIDERYLAARLGIDIEKSKDWNKLKSKFLNRFQYTGPFYDGWIRWWSPLLENWWNSLDKNPGPLPLIDAQERVEFLKKVTKLYQLMAAKPILKDFGSRFWTVCASRKKPLDPIDGLMIESRDKYPWQERKYISIIAALEREHVKEELSIHILDRDKFKEYSKQVAQKKNAQKH